MAIQDNANSLHTNAYDEAITNHRRKLAALKDSVDVNKCGWTKTEETMQGAYIVDELTDDSLRKPCFKFEAISTTWRCAHLMETITSSKIQDESCTTSRKHDGMLPISAEYLPEPQRRRL